MKEQIEREQTLTMGMPRFLGVIRVKIPETISDYMKRDTNIEKIGMEIAMNYEKQNNRTPTDVGSENLGFDIRSSDKKGNILPDVFLLPENSKALDLAFAVHTDIGNRFIGAIDCKTGKKLGKESMLKNGDIVKILTK